MAWDKNDWAAFILIVAICVIGTIAALYLLGVFPGSINTVFPFRKESKQILNQLLNLPTLNP